MDEQRPGTARGVRGLRVPPGFENLASRQETEAGKGSEGPSRFSSGAVHGIFPFPPPRDSPLSPRSDDSSSSSYSPVLSSLSGSNFSDFSTRPLAQSFYPAHDDMEGSTNAWFSGHHHRAMVEVMRQKFQEILGYERTKNRSILHLDWVAANPDDPANKEGAAPVGGMSYEKRQLSNTIANAVMTITNGVKGWSPKAGWNRTMLYGSWLHDHKGQRQYFLEFQIKRISGDDPELLEICGMDSGAVWLALHDENAADIEPARWSAAPPTARALPDPPKPDTFPSTETKETKPVAPGPTSSLEVPTCYADKSKGNALPEGQANIDDSAAPREGLDIDREQTTTEPTSSGQSAQEPAQLPNIDQLALDMNTESATATTSATVKEEEESPPRIGIPHSQPLPNTGSYDSLHHPSDDGISPPGSPTTLSPDSTDESLNEEESTRPHGNHTIYLADGTNKHNLPRPGFASMAPAHQLPLRSAAQLAAHQAEWDRCFAAKEAEIAHIYRFNADPAFITRRERSFIYAVRVVAIPDRGHVTNVFTGPPFQDRYGTLIAQGGWVVPPLEERVAWRDSHKRAYRNKGAKAGKYEGPPFPKVDCAVPVKFDWSGDQMPRYFGQAAPVWRELAEPCLEDVYWMIWQLLGGRQFVGFTPGTGFGTSRADIRGNPELLAQCPFKSPSVEALYHAASYPREREVKEKM